MLVQNIIAIDAHTNLVLNVVKAKCCNHHAVIYK